MTKDLKTGLCLYLILLFNVQTSLWEVWKYEGFGTNAMDCIFSKVHNLFSFIVNSTTNQVQALKLLGQAIT